MKIKLKDIILLASVLILAVAALVTVKLFNSGGEIAEVKINGKTVASLPLDTNTEYDTGIGNIVCVENGLVYMKWADCPEGDCTHHKPISKSGEIIVCLPNNVTVTVTGSGESEVDAVS